VGEKECGKYSLLPHSPRWFYVTVYRPESVAEQMASVVATAASDLASAHAVPAVAVASDLASVAVPVASAASDLASVAVGAVASALDSNHLHRLHLCLCLCLCPYLSYQEERFRAR
jgi:hypothetical protein